MTRFLWLVLLMSIALGLGACVRLGRITPYDLGVELQDSGELPAAIEQYKEMLAQYPDHVHARFNLAVIYHDQQKYQAAKEHYWRILQHSPEHARSLVNLADIAMAENDPSRAYLLLLRAVDAEPDRAYPYSYLGRHLQERGRLTEARLAYEHALAIENDALTHYRLGMLWLQQGDKTKAADHFTQAIELDTDDSKSLYQLAMLYIEAGKTAEAIRYLQRLTHLTPHQAEIFLLLGKLYIQQREYSTAAVHLWEARDLQPDAPEVERLLLHVYEQLVVKQREVLQRRSPPQTAPAPSVARDGRQRRQ
jgi:tetratricopeptide (TPR) repeat protein